MYNFFPKAKTSQEKAAQDFVVEQLKKKFLILAKQENYPKTPDITSELDFIVNTVKEFETENLKNLDQQPDKDYNNNGNNKEKE
jgi:hypothetical protein